MFGNVTRDEALASVGPGWASLINRLYDFLPEGASVDQVKEKFGGLRFYFSGDSGEGFYDLVDAAEVESYSICEKCGEPGSLRSDQYWLLTLCDKHNEERNSERAKRS